MKIKIISEKENLLLKRKEVHFEVKHDETGSTPQRLEVKEAVANTLKVKPNLIFVKRLETKTGTHMAVGLANVYAAVDQARLVEPEYVIKRNAPPEKTKSEEEE